jgi:hypothetical protein
MLQSIDAEDKPGKRLSMFRLDSSLISGRTERFLREDVPWLAVGNLPIFVTPGILPDYIEPFLAWARQGGGGRKLGDMLKPFFRAWRKESGYQRGSKDFPSLCGRSWEDMVVLDAKPRTWDCSFLLLPTRPQG